MTLIKNSPDTEEKLQILSNDSKYDLACSCATREDEHRKRSRDGKWIYPVILPNGGRTFLFKTLLSNECVNNCRYCPLRTGADTERCSLGPEETVRVFLRYYRARRVSGLFLSSGVAGGADNTMDRINRVALELRKRRFKGYIHLKIIPGASDEAIKQAISLASAVSLNIETAGENRFANLSTTKDYLRDIIRPIRLISRLTGKGTRYSRVKHTTQFVVGASDETDSEIIKYSGRLYGHLGLSRIYFSAYQKGEGDPGLPGERSRGDSGDLLTREHRLYQADWLMRKYGFSAEEIPVGIDGNLSLLTDPKAVWAEAHPEFFPVNVNTDSRERLLRVPGIGFVMAEHVMRLRKEGVRIKSVEDMGKRTKLLGKAEKFLAF